MDPPSLRWHSWQNVVDSAYDRPAYQEKLTRRVCVPLAAAMVVAVVLVVLRPPFACAPSSDTITPASVSLTRVACWAVAAATAVVVLVQSELFKAKSPVPEAACNTTS